MAAALLHRVPAIFIGFRGLLAALAILGTIYLVTSLRCITTAAIDRRSVSFWSLKLLSVTFCHFAGATPFSRDTARTSDGVAPKARRNDRLK